jgi:hypothetical protein
MSGQYGVQELDRRAGFRDPPPSLPAPRNRRTSCWRLTGRTAYGTRGYGLWRRPPWGGTVPALRQGGWSIQPAAAIMRVGAYSGVLWLRTEQGWQGTHQRPPRLCPVAGCRSVPDPVVGDLLYIGLGADWDMPSGRVHSFKTATIVLSLPPRAFEKTGSMPTSVPFWPFTNPKL